MSTEQISDFKCNLIQFGKSSTNHHQIFLQQYTGQSNNQYKPLGRTLFITNLPPYVTLESLRVVFASVEDVFLQNMPTNKSKRGFQMGYVVFKNAQALEAALRLNQTAILSTLEEPIKTGIDKWITNYNSSLHVHKQVYENIMKVTGQSKLKEDKVTNEDAVDDSGWTLVSKSKGNSTFRRTENASNKLKEINKLKATQNDFKKNYTFQIKQEKKKQITLLRQNFQESKEKVAAMKKLRHFKPY